MITTPFTSLVGCELPIQQAGMGGIATPELAAAVTGAGGLGTLAGVMLPADVIAATLDDLRTQVDGPIAINFLMPFVDPESVEAASSRAAVVEFFYGDPDPELVRIVHEGGALAFWQVGSLAEAQAAVAAGCDAIIAQGVEAGGHVRGKVSLFPLLAEVLPAIDVPLIAAGGIGDARGVAAVLAAGASAARIGTRFVAATESNAHPAYVDALIDAHATDTVLTEAFGVMWPDAPHRVLRSCIAAAECHDSDVVAHNQVGGELVPVAKFSPEPPEVTSSGNVQAMAMYAGESVTSVRSVQPAADIVRELAEGAAALLQRAPSPTAVA